MNMAPMLNLQQAQLLVTAMHEVARIDGVAAVEDLMIRSFYNDCRADSAAIADYDNLSRAAFDAETARQIFNTVDARDLFVRTCIYVGYADGHFGAAERKRVGEMALALGMSPEVYDGIIETVHDHLIGQFAHVLNVEALQAVSKETRPG
ncbi:MAG: TerB family tellurite resistance protein [Solimonas sp.]